MERWERTGTTLGAGGQGQVFVVTDRTGKVEGNFALKILTNAQRAGRLDLEVSTMKSLSRTGAKVIPIVDDYIDSEPGAKRPWYVMQIANQGSLQDSITPNVCFGGSEESALRTFARIVEAVAGLHTAGVAHRDLKPANILRHDGEILLCDLGLCLPLDDVGDSDRLTGALERIGSIHYTPKEAFRLQPVDRKQFAFDAYALGKILYDLLAGRTLPGFTSPNDADYDLLKLRGKRLYSGVNAVLRGLLDDDPTGRLATLQALPSRVQSLVDWASEATGSSTGDELRETMAGASEALARAFVIFAPAPATETLKQECEDLARQVASVWAASPATTRMQSDLVTPNAKVLSMTPTSVNARLRDFVTGPFVKTHRGLEPLEDRGYPARPSVETGCSIGIVPIGDATATLPQWWLDSLIAGKDGQLSAAFALTTRQPGINSYTDIVDGTQMCFKGAPDDPDLIRKILNYAEDQPRVFAARVIQEIDQLIGSK
jgi:serine/threonine protein kinase